MHKLPRDYELYRLIRTKRRSRAFRREHSRPKVNACHDSLQPGIIDVRPRLLLLSRGTLFCFRARGSPCAPIDFCKRNLPHLRDQVSHRSSDLSVTLSSVFYLYRTRKGNFIMRQSCGQYSGRSFGAYPSSIKRLGPTCETTYAFEILKKD